MTGCTSIPSTRGAESEPGVPPGIGGVAPEVGDGAAELTPLDVPPAAAVVVNGAKDVSG